MNKVNGLLTGATLAALLFGSATFAVADDDDDRPVAETRPATDITSRAARLNAAVEQEGHSTTYRFEYGPTTSYGQSTAEGTLPADSATLRSVNTAVTGLTPKRLYHFRVRATNHHGTDIGADRTFTTTAGNGTPAGPLGTSAQAPPPKLGSSVVVAVLQGTIKVKRSGGAGYTTLGAGDNIPVGSFVDTRHGTVKLTSSLGEGKTQAGEFRGGLFKVRQARKGNGLTSLVLRGANFSRCADKSKSSGDARHKRRAPKRRLFGRDKGGRFRTHGRNSVATVRGTSWVTTDTCAGTRTTVHKGAVSVRTRGRAKSVLVRAGHSFLARRAHHKPRRITTAPRG